MKLREDKNYIEHYLNKDFEFLVLRKRVFILLCSFYIFMTSFSLIINVWGKNGITLPNIYILVSIKVIYISSLITCLFVAKRKTFFEFKKLEIVLIVISLLSILTNILFGIISLDPVSLMGILVSTILPIQLIHQFINRLVLKVILYITVLVSFYSMTFYFIQNTPLGVQDPIMSIIIISFFLFLSILFPGILNSAVKSKLDEIVFEKSFYDNETGVKNHIMLIEDLDQLLKNSLKKNKSLTIYALHIVEFQKIIEKKGYHFRTLLLNQIGERLGELNLRFDIYKITGVVFCLIPNRGNYNSSIDIKKEIDNVFSNMFKIKNEILEIKYNIFATQAPEDGRDSTQIISNLYNSASRMQTNNIANQSIVWFDHNTNKIAEREFILENDLKNMIENSDYLLLIQPKVSLHNGKIQGGEFLSRWNHPVFGQISPIEFIPLLEQNNLMIDFTEAICNKIIKFSNDLQSKINREITFAVNANASILNIDSFIDFLIVVSKKIKPYILEIEITEDVFLKMETHLLKNLDRLRNNDINLALDDFGTGFSNMSYLQELKVNTIKIDKIFISSLELGNKSYAIVKALIDMSHSFNIKVVAEGVETVKQNNILKELDCDIIQGYLYYKPIEMREFMTLLINNN